MDQLKIKRGENMPKKPEIEIKAKCKDCGHEPSGKLQGNWKVYDTACEKCGGKVGLDFKEEKGK